MKRITLALFVMCVFVGGCQILSSEKTTTPEISIEPSPILADAEIDIEISSSDEFIMPFCGGITYQIEKLESQSWKVFSGHYGPCTANLKPETYPSKSFMINYSISEEGTYRFVSSFKFNSDGEFKPLYSDQFEVVSEK